jgi:hypothetical protein
LSGDAPALSIVVPTCHPWPEVEPTLAAIFAAEEEFADFEVILGDGDGNGAPPPGVPRDPRLEVITIPGGSVFDLRAAGFARARGEIVAMTEDHCVPAPGWAGQVVEAHVRHPDIIGIAGGVTNGSVDSAWDWANYLMTFAEHMPPMPDLQTVRAPSVANGSVKRARAAIPPEPAPGWFEMGLMAELMGTGQVVRDDGSQVAHVQSQGGWRGTLAAHFHNGRSSAGLRVERPGLATARGDLGRLARLPAQLTRELRAALSRRPPLQGKAATGARLVPVLASAHAVGELAGLLTGPGSSVDKLT